ncbi:MAG: hypothetical protein C6Y22_26565 [Hapalosiphonaceae cyanobacterium JJU2]|nr:MAG: hypothetical protein C6Y22_26565 [Hapalosiphonaceae cyanobacterium JJU2]
MCSGIFGNCYQTFKNQGAFLFNYESIIVFYKKFIAAIATSEKHIIAALSLLQGGDCLYLGSHKCDY